MPHSAPSSPLTLDELAALSDEIAALARVGMPLEQGLAALGSEMPGRLGSTAARLGDALRRGQSLDQAMAACGSTFPPMYRAVIEAGKRSGRLAAAVEDLATCARRLAELRRVTGTALIYPAFVVLLAYGLFLFSAVVLAPELLQTYRVFRVQEPAALLWVVGLGQSAAWWAPIVPLVFLAGWIIWWLRSGQASVVQPGWAGRRFGWVLGSRRLIRSSVAAMFANLLAVLLEHHVPLPDALSLAAEATGDEQLAGGAKAAAQAVSAGKPFPPERPLRQALPPTLLLLLRGRYGQGILVRALRTAATDYHRQAVTLAERQATLLPVLFTLVFGGSATLAYCLLVMAPWAFLLQRIK